MTTSLSEVLEIKRQQDVVKKFVVNHPHYYACPANHELLVTWVEKHYGDAPFEYLHLKEAFKGFNYGVQKGKTKGYVEATNDVLKDLAQEKK